MRPFTTPPKGPSGGSDAVARAKPKVVYTQSVKPGKRYIVQFRNVEDPISEWRTCTDAFHFKWVAILCVRTVRDTKLEYRVVDTHDV